MTQYPPGGGATALEKQQRPLGCDEATDQSLVTRFEVRRGAAPRVREMEQRPCNEAEVGELASSLFIS